MSFGAWCFIVAVEVIVCVSCGSIVGRPRAAETDGALLGLLFGPIGVLAAFRLDKRPQCPRCMARLDPPACVCRYCLQSLRWVDGAPVAETVRAIARV